MARGLDDIVVRRVEFLTAYQNAAYARRYSDAVAAVTAAETALIPGEHSLAETVAKALFKLMAYKDEYEVARLHVDSGFLDGIREQFDGAVKIHFHMAPPLLAARDETTGHLKKRTYGSWMRLAFHLLARLRGLRGTPFDTFGRTAERRLERRLIEDYLEMLQRLIAALDRGTHAVAIEIAALPLTMRGFGHVKEASVTAALKRQAELLRRLEAPSVPSRAAE
jgi:indolepyruvate ferredoxin oxidoreductase